MTDHLSEAAIQQYALDGGKCPAWMTEHVRVCEHCSMQVNNYRLIFKEVGQMEVPEIRVEIDISKLVLAPARQKKNLSLIYWLVGAGLVMLVTGWFFRTFLLSIAGDIPVLILYVLVGVSAGIAIVRGLGMIIQYRHQLKNLDLS